MCAILELCHGVSAVTSRNDVWNFECPIKVGCCDAMGVSLVRAPCQFGFGNEHNSCAICGFSVVPGNDAGYPPQTLADANIKIRVFSGHENAFLERIARTLED